MILVQRISCVCRCKKCRDSQQKKSLMMTKDRFTLIELLVTVAILSILASMLLPTLARARAYARRTACMNNLDQMGLGSSMYADDFEQFPVLFHDNYDPEYADRISYQWDTYGIVLFEKTQNMGHLLNEGYIVPTTLYCPSPKLLAATITSSTAITSRGRRSIRDGKATSAPATTTTRTRSAPATSGANTRNRPTLIPPRRWQSTR